MHTQEICFPDQRALAVFPAERSDLADAISLLGLDGNYPVIVLIGGEIDPQHLDVTWRAVQTLSRVAEELNAVVICGGTDMGVMAAIGQMRSQKRYAFPLVGIAPEEVVTWPDGPRGSKFLWWGTQRWPLESHYSHFILVPGSQFGEESPWIVDTATRLSGSHRAVTILINGGEVSRKDIALSLKNGRRVIALNHTGRLADELAEQANTHPLISAVAAAAEQKIVDRVHAVLAVNEAASTPRSTINVT